MTYEQIMEVFKEQLEICKNLEVASFRQGYQIFMWSEEEEIYMPVFSPLKTPQELFDSLLDITKAFYEIEYENPDTGEISEIHRIIIDKIIAGLTEKYNFLS